MPQVSAVLEQVPLHNNKVKYPFIVSHLTLKKQMSHKSNLALEKRILQAIKSVSLKTFFFSTKIRFDFYVFLVLNYLFIGTIVC